MAEKPATTKIETHMITAFWGGVSYKICLTEYFYVDNNVDMNKKNLPTEIYLLLRSRILSFKILPGVKISDKEIAEELGISRTPVREALIRLTAHGLVQSLHNKGFTVREFSVKEVQDIYTLREALEVLAVKLAIRNMNPERVQVLETLLSSYPSLIASKNSNEFNKADENFHTCIAEFSDNVALKNQLNSLHDQLAILRRYAHLLSERWRDAYEEETYRDHRNIFNYMINNELTKAEQAMSKHIKASMDSVVTALKENRNE